MQQVNEQGRERAQQRYRQLDGGIDRQADGREDEAVRKRRRERLAAQRQELEPERAAVAASVASAQNMLTVAASALQVRWASTIVRVLYLLNSLRT